MLSQFIQRMVAHVRRDFPVFAAKYKEMELKKVVSEGIQTAATYKIESEFDVARYIDLTCRLGVDFDRNPQVTWPGKILQREDLWSWEKMDELESQLALTAPRSS